MGEAGLIAIKLLVPVVEVQSCQKAQKKYPTVDGLRKIGTDQDAGPEADQLSKPKL